MHSFTKYLQKKKNVLYDLWKSPLMDFKPQNKKLNPFSVS
jgi:hypothetical protein